MPASTSPASGWRWTAAPAWCWGRPDGGTPRMSLSFGVTIPFVDHLGFTLERFEGGESGLRYTPAPEHSNRFAVAHGGAGMTRLDVAMATAARSVQPEMGVVTVEMKTSFMLPATGPLIARGRLMHRTATLAFVEATIHDSQGR